MPHLPPRPELPPYWSDLLAPWGIPAATLAPALWGVNNRCWFVESASGRYVLRVYSVASQDTVRSEHALLAVLSAPRCRSPRRDHLRQETDPHAQWS